MLERTTSNQAKTWLIDFLFLSTFLGGLFFIMLGDLALFVPDEGRYAEIAREMVTNHNYITPYLNGIKYFEKPVLFYWLEALMIHWQGADVFALRSINALLSLIGCLLTYATARKLYDRRTGFIASLILATSVLYFVMAHMISLDLPVTVFISTSLFCFLLGTSRLISTADYKVDTAHSAHQGYFLTAAVFAAFAVLTKGLIGLLFPALVITTWIGFMNYWRFIPYLPIFRCVLIFMLIAAPWHIIVSLKNPEFFHFYFIEQHFLRYTTLAIGHYQPAWFFIPCLILGLFPWIVFLPQAFYNLLQSGWKNRYTHHAEYFFLIWALVIFLFFSFSKSKLIPYILPIFPPLAILIARYITMSWQKTKSLSLLIGCHCLLLFSIFIAYTLYHFTQDRILPDPSVAKLYFNTAACFLVIGSILACAFSYKRAQYAIILIFITAWLFLITMLAALPAIETRTILPLANTLNKLIQPADEVVSYNQYHQDLPFYTARRITIVNWRNELSYGMQHQDAHDWMINDETFWQRYESKKRLFIILSKDEYIHFLTQHPKAKTFILAQTTTHFLISNQG